MSLFPCLSHILIFTVSRFFPVFVSLCLSLSPFVSLCLFLSLYISFCLSMSLSATLPLFFSLSITRFYLSFFYLEKSTSLSFAHFLSLIYLSTPIPWQTFLYILKKPFPTQYIGFSLPRILFSLYSFIAFKISYLIYLTM